MHKFFIDFSDFLMRKNLNGEYHHLFRLVEKKPLKFMRLVKNLLASREIDFEQKIKPLLEIQDRDGNTPLHILASKNSSKFIELMKQLLAKTGIELQNYIPALQRNSNGEEFVIAVNGILSLYFRDGESALNSGESLSSQGATFFSPEDNRTESKKREREREESPAGEKKIQRP